jgi:alpha-L-fucosidase 2
MTFLSDPLRQMPYQPFGDLRLQFPDQEAAADYRRSLDLDTAVATVTYRSGGARFRRDVFASYPDQVVVVRIMADVPGRIRFTLKLDSPHKGSRTKTDGPANTLVLSGQMEDDGLRFEAHVRVQVSGGTVTPEPDGGLSVSGADSALLLLSAHTSFKTFEDITGRPDARCAAVLQRLRGRSYDSLLTAHLTDYQRLFRRVGIDLGRSRPDRANLPTDQRLLKVKTGGPEGDPGLIALYFQYGRYLLIASSRPGGQPANLQGIWNDLLDPPWESKWTTNINVEMNYWPAELTNLSECHEPLFDLVDDLAVSGARTAREQYGCRGWVLHHNTDLWRGTAPINNFDGIWPTGGAWLCHHLWERYAFTGDTTFLTRRAFPVMKQAALFFIDFLTRDPGTGWLVTTPSFSPEQGTLTAGPAMDSQLIRALMNHTLDAARLLPPDRRREEKAFIASLTTVRDKLAPDQIGKYGQLQEWLQDIDVPNNNHRHLSPLWAMYPGADITPAAPRLWEAAKLLLRWRGDGSTGWSYAWRIPLWARAGDAEFAYRQLTGLLQKKTLPNLWDLCGPFQIDGNFGATAGIAEMLLQSHEKIATPSGSPVPVLALLPALPRAWPSGSVSGLCARGGFTLDMTWEGGALRSAVITSKCGGACRVRTGGRTVSLSTKPGGRYTLDSRLQMKAESG